MYSSIGGVNNKSLTRKHHNPLRSNHQQHDKRPQTHARHRADSYVHWYNPTNTSWYTTNFLRQRTTILYTMHHSAWVVSVFASWSKSLQFHSRTHYANAHRNDYVEHGLQTTVSVSPASPFTRGDRLYLEWRHAQGKGSNGARRSRGAATPSRHHKFCWLLKSAL